MKHKKPPVLLNREDAAQKLTEKLARYKNRDACIISISRVGIALAGHVARALRANLFFVPTEVVRHPGDPIRVLGVVSPEHVTMGELDRDIPQEFIYRRTRTLQTRLAVKYRNVYSYIGSGFRDRVVILIEDCVETPEKILACVDIIRRQQPDKIVIATPIVSTHGVHDLITEVDSVIFLNMFSDKNIRSACSDLEPISDDDIARLMEMETV